MLANNITEFHGDPAGRKTFTLWFKHWMDIFHDDFKLNFLMLMFVHNFFQNWNRAKTTLKTHTTECNNLLIIKRDTTLVKKKKWGFITNQQQRRYAHFWVFKTYKCNISNWNRHKEIFCNQNSYKNSTWQK